MKERRISLVVILVFGCFLTAIFFARPNFQNGVAAEELTVNVLVDFDQAAAIAKVREQIKGKEKEPAEKVFKNIQTLKGVPAGRVLAIMEFGYARSLGVNCTHCHTIDKWEAGDKAQKQIAREMSAMVGKINSELLKSVKNINDKAAINCTTCHRGQVVPALNLPMPGPSATATPNPKPSN